MRDGIKIGASLFAQAFLLGLAVACPAVGVPVMVLFWVVAYLVS